MLRAGDDARRARAILGQALAHLGLALPGVALYLIILPRLYGFSTLGRLIDLFLMVLPFVLSVSFLAQFISAWFTRRETAVVLFIAVSLPLFFMVGVSWPVEAIPDFICAASRAFPSTSAIDGLVRINQMGATLHDVSRDWISLWALTGIYGLLAVLAAHMSNREGDRRCAASLARRILGFLGLVVAIGSAAIFAYRVNAEPRFRNRSSGLFTETEYSNRADQRPPGVSSGDCGAAGA